ncbi:hypothetical protein YC2023_085507 [Brassica napus]
MFRLFRKDEAYFLSIVWALESMMSHGCFKVHFAFEGRVLVNAINRPKAWPSFRFKVNEIIRLLGNFLDWHFYCETLEANREARLIAQTAVTRDRFQSYVVCGQPRWLSQRRNDGMGNVLISVQESRQCTRIQESIQTKRGTICTRIQQTKPYISNHPKLHVHDHNCGQTQRFVFMWEIVCEPNRQKQASDKAAEAEKYWIDKERRDKSIEKGLERTQKID